jgi:SAM-dependent methyltransferase
MNGLDELVVGLITTAPFALDGCEFVKERSHRSQVRLLKVGGGRFSRARRGDSSSAAWRAIGHAETIVTAVRATRWVSTRITLPPRTLVPKTAPDDPVDYYFKPLTAPIYRARLRIASSLLGDRIYGSLLEVGFGSGIFLPELSRHTRQLVGIDVHGESKRVTEMLHRLGISADLREASLFQIPFPTGTFDALVCMSVLEHITELDGALGELRRVLRSGGVAVFGFPVRNLITDGFFRAVGYNPREIHPSSHRDILAAASAQEKLVVERKSHFPRFAPLDLAAYAACRCRAA